MFQVTEMPGKGKGVVALEAIPAGTLILSEKPIIRIPKYMYQERWSEAILPQLQGLSATQKRNFFDLNNNFPAMRPIEGIIKTNAMPLSCSLLIGGIFLTCSRFNHSCTANAAYHWNDNAEEERIFSIRDISAEEEITVNYLADELWALPVTARRAQILAKFGFDCCCARCVNSQPCEEVASDKRRERLRDIDRAVGSSHIIVTNPGKALAMCREALDLLQREEEAAPRRESVYYDAFQICVFHGDLARAGTFAALAAEAKKIWKGNEAPELGEMETFASKPESHRLAFQTKRWFSGRKSVADRLDKRTDEWLWLRAG